MRSPGAPLVLLTLVLILVGCATGPSADGPPRTEPAASSSSALAATPSRTPTRGATPSPTPSTTSRPTPTSGSAPTAAPHPTRGSTPGPADPRWRFYADDATAYRSDWFDGAHRIMIGFGCTRAPYYDADPRCPGGRGFHHGIDVALPCGTTIRAGVAGTVVDPSRPGRPGAAYGSTAFRLRVRTTGGSADVLIGHARSVLVRPGERVRAGQPIARAGDRGAPDGCHLHLERRSVDGGVSTATDPSGLLGLHS